MASIRRSRADFQMLEARYGAASQDSRVERLVAGARARGFLTKPDLLAVCRWKSPRALPLVRRNSPGEVREATAWALGTPHERLRIGALLMLHGVSWPMGSAVLHFFHSDPYPVLDVRAVWSLGLAPGPGYTFDFWWTYVRACRELSRRLGLSMRTVDRALWQYSKESSPALGAAK